MTSHISGAYVIHKKLEGDTQNLIIGMNPHPGTEVHLGAGLVRSKNNYQDIAASLTENCLANWN